MNLCLKWVLVWICQDFDVFLHLFVRNAPETSKNESPNTFSDPVSQTFRKINHFGAKLMFFVLKSSFSLRFKNSAKWSFTKMIVSNFPELYQNHIGEEVRFCFVLLHFIRTGKRKFDRNLSDLAPIMNTNSRETISWGFARVKQQVKRHTYFQNTTFFCIRTFWIHWFQKLSKMIVH